MKIVALISLALVGCKPQRVMTDFNSGNTGATGTVVQPGLRASADVVNQLVENFARVHFETDSSALNADGQAALTENARLMLANRDVRVEVQGHADERGTVDYNLILGQRRAKVVVDFLVGQGVAPSRLPVVSYGEERPLADGSGQVAWAENRRAEFRVLTGASVTGTTLN